MKKSTMKPWKKVGERYQYKGWRSLMQKDFILPDDKKASYDIFENANFVCIAAFTEDQEAILVRQFRPGPEMNLTSFPEGYIDPGEAMELAARRELLEETGFEAGEVVHLKTIRGAYTTEAKICMLAFNCKKVSAQNLDTDEFIDVRLMPLVDFRQYIRQPEEEEFTTIDCAYLALDYLANL